MDVVAIDPLAELLAAPEGRFEWANGSLIEMSPPPTFEHGRGVLFLATLLDAYAEHHDLGVVVGDSFAQRLDETIRVPDVAFFKNASRDRIKETHSEGGADLVVEIVSPDSGARDRGEKFEEYERAGIEEYWIVDPRRRIAEFYRLHNALYTPFGPDEEGRVYSSVLPGFYIRVGWLWERPKLNDAQRELGLI
ncbi:Uma2 family endonuclease [bacterium]|nr:MAG: Uma2 family endonuclease [bacterium]